MTNWDEDTLLDKVRKLLAKAEATENLAERDAFNRKAEDLIAKYGIDRALAYASGEISDTVGDKVIVLPDPYARQKAQLLVDIADPLRVKVVLKPDASRRIDGFEVHMFGFASDIERVDVLLTSLLVQSAFGLAAARPAAGSAMSASRLAAFRRDWLAGFGVKVRMRLIAAEQRAARNVGTVGTELVLAHRSDLVEAAIGAAYPQIVRRTPRRVRSAEAFRNGVAAGANADLGNARITTENRLTLSGRNQ